MVKLVKRDMSKAAESTFKVYDGDEPRPGGYRAIVKQLNMQKSSGDNLMYAPVIELLAKPGSEKAKYDGYAIFPTIPLTENEHNQTREKAFYVAMTGKDVVSPNVDVDPGKFKPGDKQKAKVIDLNGIKPEGRIVSVNLRRSTPTDDYPSRLECDLIFAARDADAGAEDAASDNIEDDEEVEGAEEDDILYEEDELMEMGLPALRKILVDEFGMKTPEAKLLKTKAALVETILNAQVDMSDDEEEPEEDEDEDEELEEEEEDDEEDEDDEDDPEAELRAELAELDRNGLKARIKKLNPDFKFLRSQTDADLIEHIVQTEPPF